MINELLLIGSVILIYSSVIVAYKLFKKSGLYAMTAVVTILANIEVLILVEGFGMEMTLGNVMFASTYLITDILSENEGKEYATKAVWIGVFVSALMLMFTQYVRLFVPSNKDIMFDSISKIFSTTPRMLLASFIGYVVSQRFDVFMYHKVWSVTTKKTGSSKTLLWLRNNVATLIAQIINTIIFNSIAFYGWYDFKILVSIMLSSYIIFIVTTFSSTPFVYLSRKIKSLG